MTPDDKRAMMAGALHRARRIIAANSVAIGQCARNDAERVLNTKALDEAYRLLGIVMDRLNGKERP